ncbi:hypothetical protein [Rubritalea tangerina]|uniref:Uncharacterized protein n=1 Tax=Rubritalea tangerina TaxID=430798 RepID=A0ABW4Z5Z0_9BACT
MKPIFLTQYLSHKNLTPQLLTHISLTFTDFPLQLDKKEKEQIM